MFTRRRPYGPITTLLGLSLVFAACGDDGEGANGADSETTSGSTSDDPTTGPGTTGETASTSEDATSSGSATEESSSGSEESSSSAGSSSSTTGGPDATDDVVELAIRRLNEGQDLAQFEAARDAFVDLLTMQPGVGTDREFEAVVDFGTFAPPDPPVFIGMTQYEDLDAFAAAGEALGGGPEAAAFFTTFTPEVFTVLRPLEAGAAVDLAGIADAQGQVLEVAARDLSQYEDFVEADYEAARDAFLALLSDQDGVVAEYQWVSVLDPNIVVGMTVYEDLDAFAAINMDAEFVGSPELANFLGGYPPLAGYLNSVVE